MSKTILIAERIIPVSSPPLDGYAVIIERDKIIGLEPFRSAEKKNPYAKRINLEGAILMPGLINLHTHLELSSLRGGLPRGIDFFKWIAELVNRKRGLKKREYNNGVHIGIKELIKTGTTSIGEITSEGISPYILSNYNIRGKVFYEVLGLSDLLTGYIWAKKRREFKRFKGNDLLDKGISPHSCYSLSYDLLKKVSKYSAKYNITLSSHISETKEEGEFIKEGRGKFKELINSLGFKSPLPFYSPSPISYFKDLGLLKKDFLAVHAVWVDESDIKIMKESSISIAHCPRSNAYLNVGKAQVMKFLKEGINVGLGTDSLASNYSLNMWEEMRTAYNLHREEGLTAYEIFKMATQSGAKALGWEDKVGTIEIGKKADLIAIKIPESAGDEIYLNLLKKTEAVLLTMVSGKVIYQEKKIWN
jgi:5-methylthioadenosine/S-adenosylhomocysteine deaminase